MLKKIVTDTGLYLLSSLIPMVLLVAINPFLAKNVSPFDYGIIGYLSSFAAIETPLIQFFITRFYLSNYYKIDLEERMRLRTLVVQSLILFSLFMSIIVGGGICFYHYLFNTESNIPLFPLLLFSIGAIWISGLFSFQLAEYRIERKTREYCKYCISSGIFRVITILICVVLLHQGAWGYEFATFVSSFVFFLITFFRLKKYIFKRIDLTLLRKLLSFCWPLAIAGCLEFFTNGYSRVLLERVGDTNEYGIYCVGDQFARYINIFTMALYSTFNPDLYESVAKFNKSKLIRVCVILLAAETLVVLFYIILAPFVIDILTAGRYIESAKYSQILSVAQIFVVGFYLVNDITVAAGYSKSVLTTKVIASLLSVLVISYLVRIGSYYGAAYGHIVTFMLFIVTNILCLLFQIKKDRKK